MYNAIIYWYITFHMIIVVAVKYTDTQREADKNAKTLPNEKQQKFIL